MDIPLNDEPTLDDLVGRVEQVKKVAQDIMTCSPPYVMGIHGKWGAGKTSFLQMLQWHLVGKCSNHPEAAAFEAKDNTAKLPAGHYEGKVAAVWFEAWRYQREAVPIAALIQQIRRQLSLEDKALNEMGKLAIVALWTMVARGTGEGARKEGERWEQEHLCDVLGTDRVSGFLESVITQLLGKRNCAARAGNGLLDR